MLGHVLHTVEYPVPFLFVLTVLVFVHEFGHFWVARRCGVKIDSFSIGFGRELFGRNDRHGTRWKLCILPFGGYVKMFGDQDAASWTEIPDTSHMNEADRRQLFANKSLGSRAAIVVAGPVANFLFTMVVFAALFSTLGERFVAPTVQEVVAGSPAEAGGVKPGDTFLLVDGIPTPQFEDIATVVSENADRPLIAHVRSGAVEHDLTITPRAASDIGENGKPTRVVRIGIKHTEEPDYIRQPVGHALGAAVSDTWKLTEGTMVAIWQMVTGTRTPDELGGVIAIGKISHESAKGGVANLVYFMAVLSVNLGLLNLFPIPVLDGGHLLFYLVEAVLGRPPSEPVMKYSFRFGLALVLTLAIFANWNDLVHLGVLDFLHKTPAQPG